MAVRTYIDVGVLIAALRGEKNLAATALSFLYDPLREYVTSDYAKIELLPKCTFHRNEDEKQFYEDFFDSSEIHVPSSDELLALAIDEGGKTGISGIDAIHVACAVVAQAEELITAERSTKPMHRANGVKIISINP
jgi:predicted nucleic acid-binding protein